MTRVVDITNPHNAELAFEHKIGDQVNMLSQSWDGKRIYFTSSLLANWDKPNEAGAEGKEGVPQFFKAFTFEGGSLSHKFTIDFGAQKLGMPHQMRFGAYSLYAKTPENSKNLAELSR